MGLVPKHKVEPVSLDIADLPFCHEGESKSQTSEMTDQSMSETWLISHLSHPRDSIVNYCTPDEISRVKYRDLDYAVQMCLEMGQNCYLAKLDMKSAFRNLPIRKQDWCWLVMMAFPPKSKKIFYFIDKTVPFGLKISCCHFQRFSNAVE